MPRRCYNLAERCFSPSYSVSDCRCECHSAYPQAVDRLNTTGPCNTTLLSRYPTSKPIRSVSFPFNADVGGERYVLDAAHALPVRSDDNPLSDGRGRSQMDIDHSHQRKPNARQARHAEAEVVDVRQPRGDDGRGRRHNRTILSCGPTGRLTNRPGTLAGQRIQTVRNRLQ